jgi:hypothetical protein
MDELKVFPLRDGCILTRNRRHTEKKDGRRKGR